MYNSMFGYFELIIGVYLLYSAITGKGQLLKNENIKKGMEAQYKKWMRILAAVLSPVILGLGALDLYNSSREVPVMIGLTTGLMIASGVVIAVLAVLSFRMTDRKAAKGAAAGKQASKPSSRAAFEFDDEDAK